MSKTLEELFKDVIAEPQKEFDWGEKEYIARLEKALDKACELLVEATSQVHDIYDEMVDDYSWISSKDEWKEYLLDETN